MTPEQRERASLAVRARMNELKLTVPTMARSAGVAEVTVRRLLDGSHWPRPTTRRQLVRALRWPEGEIERRANLRPELREFTTLELLMELCSRERSAAQHATG